MKNLIVSVIGTFLCKRILSIRNHWKKYLFRIALILFLMGLFNIIPGCLYYKVVSKSNPQVQDITENLKGGKWEIQLLRASNSGSTKQPIT